MKARLIATITALIEEQDRGLSLLQTLGKDVPKRRFDELNDLRVILVILESVEIVYRG